jgi:hypothetical protein
VWEGTKRFRYKEENDFAETGILFTDGHCWRILDERWAQRFDDQMVLSYQNYTWATMLSNLVVLAENGGTLREGPEQRVKDRACTVVTVDGHGRAPVTLFFDKETKLLTKAELHGLFMDEKLIPERKTFFLEFYFSDYQLQDGVNHWRRQEQRRNGEEYAVVQLSHVSFREKPDNSLFHVRGLEHEVLRAKEENATRAALKRGHERLEIEQLIGWMGHPNQEIALEAKKMFGAKLSTIKKLDDLRKHLKQPRTDVCLAVIDAIVGFKDRGREAKDDLADLIGREKPISERALDALEAIGQLDAVAGENRYDATILAVLVRMKAKGHKDKKALDAYLKCLKHPDEKIRDTAAKSLLTLGPQRLEQVDLEYLVERFQDKDIRLQAIKMLVDIGKAAKPVLLKVAERRDENARVAVEAIVALHSIDRANPFIANRGMDVLLNGLHHSDAGTIHEGAAKILVELGAPVVKPIMKKLLNANDPRVNKGVDGAASIRHAAYLLLQRLAAQAKEDKKVDSELSLALRGEESAFRLTWRPRELEVSGIDGELYRAVNAVISAVTELRVRAQK